MSWLLRYRCRMWLRSSMSAAPITSMAAAMLSGPLVRWLDRQTQWTLLGYGANSASAVVGALSASILSLLVFSFSIMLLAVQVAGGQLSPRIVARIFEARIIKVALSSFVFSFIYSLAVLGRIEGRVPQLPILVVVISCCSSIALFLIVIQRASWSFRPVVMLTEVAGATRAVIASLYPDAFQASEPAQPAVLKPVARSVLHSGSPGAVLAIDTAGLVGIAAKVGCVIEFVPQVGDFLATGEEMFLIHGGSPGSIDDSALRNCVALGPERTLDQDPAFGFRIIVDISIKALSPAINDPTTGALAIDQLDHLLHLLGGRRLGSGVARDSAGETRLIYRTPDWEDFVTLAVTEIRLCGATSPQVTRRLQMMFEHLLKVVPAERAAALRTQEKLLARTIERSYADAEDRALARVSDEQGFGSRQPLYHAGSEQPASEGQGKNR